MNRPSVRAAAVLAAVTGSGLPSPAHASEVAPPSVISCPEPPYPAGIDAGPQQVLTHLLIDEKGRVREVLRTDGLAPFAEPVTEAALDCQFEAATVDGVPVAVEVPLTWNFDPPAVQLMGQVRQRGTAAPLTGATLTVGDRSTTLNEDGRFTFRGLADGPHRITMIHPAWRLPPTEIEITADQALELELWA